MKSLPIRLLLTCGLAFVLAACSDSDPKLLVFTKTDDYRPGSIDAGVDALEAIAAGRGYDLEVTEDASAFSEPNLKQYAAVVFLNTSGDVLNHFQQIDFERYIQAGGGFVGIHSAAATEYGWPWYGELVGAQFADGSDGAMGVQPGVVRTVSDRPTTAGLPAEWTQTDQWPTFTPLADGVEVLLTTGDQPVAWYHEFDGGRAFYTGAGGTPQSFDDPNFLAHLEGGLAYAVGDGALDYGQVRTTRMPEENRFKKVVLGSNLDEPTELEVFGDGRVLFVERKGPVKLYVPEADSIRTIAHLDVNTTHEDGVMGLAKDPNWAENHWIYIYHSVPDVSVNRLSRFVFDGETIDLESEIPMLDVATQRQECCHTAGSIEFGPDGNLFLSTGDNTNPFQSDGYAPIDDRPGRAPFDGLGGPGNTNDLRGKILRITPQPDGSYTIPEGNLFPPGTEKTRPEIYVMGNRNPYRISVDQKTGFLYWGEVGPDAREANPNRGPLGHDEVNQAREPGFFGWPLFVGDNKPYNDYDFATQASGAPFDPEHPVNESANNTGLRELPPAQKAFIWYPYAESEEFPLVGAGGRNAMAGPVFYSDLYQEADHTFPEYFDGKLFVYDWVRGWILVATMNEAGDLLGLEPFVPSTKFANPIDMAFDEHGVMYLLEYGTGWFSRNPDARLSRIEYHGGNRAPVAHITADRIAGATPLTVTLSAEDSFDEDGEALTYRWAKGGDDAEETEGPEAAFTYTDPGTYTARLTVTDETGQTGTETIDIYAGNAAPDVTFELEGNETFYWDHHPVRYTIRVADAEDGSTEDGRIDSARVGVYFDYLEQGYDETLIAQGHQTAAAATGAEGLLQEYNCTACHGINEVSIGPSYVAVAQKYKDDPDAPAYLANKIKNGGSGVWGEQAMPANPQVTAGEVQQIVNFIIGLADDEQLARRYPLKGTFVQDAHVGAGDEGTYLLKAAYTDQGANNLPPASAQAVHILRHPRLQAEAADASHNVGATTDDDGTRWVSDIFDGSSLTFTNLDLTDVASLTPRVWAVASTHAGGRIEVHLDTPDGPMIGQATVTPQAADAAPQDLRTTIEPVQGKHDVVFVFKNSEADGNVLFLLDSVYFGHAAETASGP